MQATQNDDGSRSRGGLERAEPAAPQRRPGQLEPRGGLEMCFVAYQTCRCYPGSPPNVKPTPLTLKDFIDTKEDVHRAEKLLLLALFSPFVALPQSLAPSPLLAQRATLDQYCVTCHNQKLKTAGLMLDKLELSQIGQHPEFWEKVVRKLRAGMMPPAGMPRPKPADYEALTVAIENELDRAAAAHPHLPAPGVHRVNRTEYANA